MEKEFENLREIDKSENKVDTLEMVIRFVT